MGNKNTTYQGLVTRKKSTCTVFGEIVYRAKGLTRSNQIKTISKKFISIECISIHWSNVLLCSNKKSNNLYKNTPRKCNMQKSARTLFLLNVYPIARRLLVTTKKANQ